MREAWEGTILETLKEVVSIPSQSPLFDPEYATNGYQEQVAELYLSWAKEHAAAFGGDGENVMIFGQSAGGNSVINHLAQPASFPLFNKALVESGAYSSGAKTM